MRWIANFNDLQLDIVGIIAVLGEGSITRNAQVTSLSWWSTVPRLMPAPHALLEPERKYRLPTAAGIVAGAYSGMVKKEINFFAQLLHPEPLEDYQVELVQVTRKVAPAGPKTLRSFGPKKYGPLFWVSIVGSAMALALIALSIYYHDGFSLLATIMLSMVSSFVGFGTHWSLVFQEPKVEREGKGVIPRSDVIIYYPNGSIRVIRPGSEHIARLYFQTEHAQYVIDDTPYRTLALFSTVMLMTGVVSLANASNILQVAFAASYILLNVLYWAVSALKPCKYHWQHEYKTEVMPIQHLQNQEPDGLIVIGRVEEFKKRVRDEWRRFQEAWILEKKRSGAYKRAETVFEKNKEARNFTGALWTAIVLTGTSQWLNEATTIAPMNAAWKEWLREAGDQVRPRLEDGDSPGRPNDEWDGRFEPHRRPRILTGLDWSFTPATKENLGSSSRKRRIKIKSWDYQGRLTEILRKHAPQTRLPLPDEIPGEDASAAAAASEKDRLIPAVAEEV
ncbi:uncharacterized protein Z520_03040 [Fonsecaea multimorphosa CBS 102226]|uniref:Uncharacterized protein n=1 Tax=Fonsecaea multimorphosa CBS 102226 TaxID=1442371 RepID=A0A0D2K6L6_9EURO|nr:uncharacterized protein Z520_03040 [Fonsecaea multimorphosa CBS 102226]KIY01488.1 hypothetical protein Z520_03040 [Fonsecaea multimorphosa CBS 102226]OAL28250.1 hypothetical protein AYO22_02956 [Fonsecaea multimorphosa]